MFNGEAEEAANFYAGVLDGRIGNLHCFGVQWAVMYSEEA
jgi:predicted 3-demethylubiquinone-9 3-methyltransferase (glyoxalase superfamily)